MWSPFCCWWHVNSPAPSHLTLPPLHVPAPLAACSLVLIVLLALPGAVSTTFGSPKVLMSVGSFLKSAPGAAYDAAAKVPGALAEAPAAAKRAAAAAGAATSEAVARAGSSVGKLGGRSKAELAVPVEGAAAAGPDPGLDGKHAEDGGHQPAAAPGMIDLSRAPTTSQETPYFVCELWPRWRQPAAGWELAGGRQGVVSLGACGRGREGVCRRRFPSAGRFAVHPMHSRLPLCADAVMAFALYIAGMVLTALGTVRVQKQEGG